MFFFFFWTMDHRTRPIPIATTIDGPSALDLAHARKSSFHSCFRRTITTVSIAQTGDRHSCQASNTGLCFAGLCFREKKENFQKNTRGRSWSSQKVPSDGAEFSKRPPRHRRNQKPQSLNIWRQVFQKRGKQKNSSKRA